MFLSECYRDMIVAFTETESMLVRRFNWVVYKTSTGYTTIVSKTINKFRKKGRANGKSISKELKKLKSYFGAVTRRNEIRYIPSVGI